MYQKRYILPLRQPLLELSLLYSFCLQSKMTKGEDFTSPLSQKDTLFMIT